MRSLEDAYDLVVVGAGPGGCAAAVWAARHDLRAALVDAPRGGLRSRRGAALGPGVEPLLWHLGLLERAEARGLLGEPASQAWARPSRRLAQGEREDPPRWEPLQRFLIEEAASLGVNVLSSCPAMRAMQRRCGRVVGVDTELGPLVSELTLDAAGERRWLARQLGLPAGPGGGLTRSAGAGFFLLGDAACAVDPSPERGLLRAMVSGIKAAELSDKLLHDELSEAQAAREHQLLLERLSSQSLTTSADELEACLVP